MIKSIFTLTTGLALAAGAVAQSQIYADRFQAIRAGVVVLDADRVGADPAQSDAPYAFYNLQRAGSLRPATWNFVNPFAPSLFDAARAGRWNALRTANGFAGPGDPPAIPENAKITKANAAYWEIFLTSMPESALAAYDVLLVAPRTFLSLNPAEREKLRRFMDKGGTLWVDMGGIDPSTGIDAINNVPLAAVPDRASSGTQAPRGDFRSPLLRRPNRLTPDEINLLLTNSDITRGQANYTTLAPIPAGGYQPLYGSLFGEFGVLQ